VIERHFPKVPYSISLISMKYPFFSKWQKNHCAKNGLLSAHISMICLTTDKNQGEFMNFMAVHRAFDDIPNRTPAAPAGKGHISPSIAVPAQKAHLPLRYPGKTRQAGKKTESPPFWKRRARFSVRGCSWPESEN